MSVNHSQGGASAARRARVPAAIAAVIAALTAGCAHGPSVTRLTYPPSPGAAAPAPGGDASPTVAVRGLTDLRREPRDVVAKVWDGHRNFEVVTPDDVPAWATGALRVELERLGVRVADAGETEGLAVIGGELVDVRCEALVPTYAGRVTIRAWLKKGEERPLDRVYVGSGGRGAMASPTSGIYERCLADALRDAATRIAADAKAVALGGAPPPAKVEPPEPEPPVLSGAAGATVGLVLAEGLLVGYSALAARYPQGVGWTFVVLSPVAAGSGSGSATVAVATAGGFAAIGLYNALVLKSDRYSRGERFWQNLAAMHVVAIGATVAGWLEGPDDAGAEGQTVAVGIGLGGDGPALLLGGRF